MGQAVLNFPIILLGIFATSLDIGYFSAASKLVFFLLAIDRAIYSLFYPLVAKTAASKPAELAAQIRRVLRYLFIIALPICVGGLVVARPIIALTFGSQYEESVPLMQILLLYFLFTVLNSIFAYAVIAVGNEKRYSTIIVTISLLLFAFLVPLTLFWKARGASIGMVIGEFFMMALMYRECRKSLQKPLVLWFMRPLASSLLMGTILIILPSTNFFVSLSVGIVAYALVLLLLKGLTKEDLVFLKERLI
jgi:O-antigen/teichoic acid export membrane protein